MLFGLTVCGRGETQEGLTVRCPYCRSVEDKVVDSRTSEEGVSIRRRRECLACSRRFTTFERAEALPLRIVKRSGERVPYDRTKVIDGLRKACANRPVTAEGIETVADEIEDALRAPGVAEVSSQDVGMALLDRLRELDDVAYIRFASVYKDFQELNDFERELGYLQKKTPPKNGVDRARSAVGPGP